MADESTYDFAEKPAGESPPGGNPADAPSPVSSTPIPKPPATPLAERHCPHCGYRIAGDKPRTRCPECRGALDASIADRLQFSRPEWLRSISIGPLLLACAIICHMGAIAFAWSNGPLGRITQAFHILAAACVCGGAWIMTADEGPGAPASRRALLGIVARWTSLLVALLWILAILMFATGRSSSMHGVRTLALALMIVEAFCLCGYLAGLADRIPNDSLSAQFRNMAWALAGAILIAIWAQYYDPQDFFTWLFFCTFPLVGGLCGLMLWAIIAFIRMAVELRFVAGVSKNQSQHRVPIDSKPT